MRDRTDSFKSKYLDFRSSDFDAFRTTYGPRQGADLDQKWGKSDEGIFWGSDLKISKFRKKNFYLWIFGFRTPTRRYPGSIPTMFAPGTFGLGGTVFELGVPKEFQNETPRPDSRFSSERFFSNSAQSLPGGRANFCNIQNGGKGGQNTPKIGPQKSPNFPLAANP